VKGGGRDTADPLPLPCLWLFRTPIWVEFQMEPGTNVTRSGGAPNARVEIRVSAADATESGLQIGEHHSSRTWDSPRPHLRHSRWVVEPAAGFGVTRRTTGRGGPVIERTGPPFTSN